MVDVIAQRGASLLIRVSDTHARILDTRYHRYFPETNIDSALARGWWEPYTGDLATVEAEIAQAEDIQPPYKTPIIYT